MDKDTYQIILVDDHELLLSSLGEMINAQKNLNVAMSFTLGEELIEQCDQFQADLYILDLNLPGLNGLETAEKLLKKYPAIKLMILTMHKEWSLIKKMHQIGIKGYLPKSCDKDEFLFAIHQILKGKTYFSSIENEKIFEESIKQEERSGDDLVKVSTLSNREKEIIHFLCQGLSNKQIAEKLFVSHKTIGNHRNNIMKKLNVHNIVELIRFSFKNGLEK
jgi:DNA-binding NarL/FixJ family response regulator